jgi:hypothetical protein
MRVGMIDLFNKGARLALLAFFFALFLLPTTRAAFPEYELVFEPTSDDASVWTLNLLNQQLGPTHIYGNFSFKLVNPVNVSYVEYRVGEIDDNESTWYWNLPLMLNDTSEPFEWNFSTLDFSVGVHSIGVTAFNTEGNGVKYHETTATLFFEHQDRSADQILYTGVSLTIVITGICIVGFVSYALFKRHSSRTPSS